jgi:hypothetical protein
MQIWIVTRCDNDFGSLYCVTEIRNGDLHLLLGVAEAQGIVIRLCPEDK